MIKGKEKEQRNYSKYVGLFNANVVAVNPTKEELGKLLNTTIEKDSEYAGVSDSGAKKLTLSFWLKEVNNNNLFNVRFNIEDTDVVSSTGKNQYINNIGTTSYAENKSSVPSFLTDNGREIRNAKKGEELLYKFLRSWLSNLDYQNESTELYMDFKKLISGKISELKDAISSFSTQEICALATVRTATDGKEYQGVYSYEFMPEYCLDSFTGRAKRYKAVDKFIEKVTDPQYGCKDFYELTPLKEYDASKNIISGNDNPILNPQTQPSSKVEVRSKEEIEEDIDDLPF